MVISRGFALVDTLRRTNKITFDPTKAINVRSMLKLKFTQVLCNFNYVRLSLLVR